MQDTHTSEPVAKTKGDFSPSWNAQTNIIKQVRNWKTIGKIYAKRCFFFKSQQTMLKPQILEVFLGFPLGRLTLGDSWIVNIVGLGWFGGAVVLSLELLDWGSFLIQYREFLLYSATKFVAVIKFLGVLL